jgi:hypothetical protein
MYSEVEFIQSRWVHLAGGLPAHSRLTFGGIATKEKMVKNGGWTPRVHPESNQNMWRSVKSSVSGPNLIHLESGRNQWGMTKTSFFLLCRIGM